MKLLGVSYEINVSSGVNFFNLHSLTCSNYDYDDDYDYDDEGLVKHLKVLVTYVVLVYVSSLSGYVRDVLMPFKVLIFF